jgi:hypothetical protein
VPKPGAVWIHTQGLSPASKDEIKERAKNYPSGIYAFQGRISQYPYQTD